jgi:hypothetical protein
MSLMTNGSPVSIRAQESGPRGLPNIFKRFSARLSVPECALARRPANDAYLLVLLADQELGAGRGEQAQSLLEAAYASFDEATGTV